MTFPCRRLALALLLLAVGACRGERHPRWPAENRLTIALESAPAHLDTRVGTDQASDRVFDLMACGLVAKAPNGDLVPSLASTWELLDEGRRYRFHLRPDARFHDGRPVEAADVAATFGSLLDGSVVTSKRGAFTLLRKVEAVDPQTVDFVLESPSGPFLYELSSALGILPRGTGPQEQNARPIGCGPFRLVSRTPERLLFRAFDGAFGGRPILDEVELKVVPDSTVRALELLKGSVQLVINDLPPDLVPPFRANPDFQVVEKAGGSYAYLGLNLDDPALSDVRVRRALALSIDRERLVATIWRGFGVVTETMIPPGSWARNDELPAVHYDPQAAAQLLEAAGYHDPDGPGPAPRLTLGYKASSSEIALLQAQAIAEMTAHAGIRLEVRPLEFATFYADITRGSFQIFSLQRTAILDPNLYRLVLHSQALPPQGQNRGHYQNAAFDRLIDLGAALSDRASRRPYYLEAQRLVAEDLPYISLFTKKNFAVMASTLEGYESYPSGELLGVRRLHWRRPER